jgi:hypothetical protein
MRPRLFPIGFFLLSAGSSAAASEATSSLNVVIPTGAPSALSTQLDSAAVDFRLTPQFETQTGLHHLYVRASGYRTLVYTIRIQPAAIHHLTLGPFVPAPKRLTPWGFVGLAMIGAGAASLVGAGISAGVSIGRSSVADGRCTPTGACDPSGLAARADARMFADISTVTLLTGAVSLSLGFVAFLLGRTYRDMPILLDESSREGR